MNSLSDRENQVLASLAEGKPSKRIARDLGMSFGTVKSHRRNIMRKLGIDNVAELTQYAIRTGLVKLTPPDECTDVPHPNG